MSALRRLLCLLVGHQIVEVGMLTIEGQAIPVASCDRCHAGG